MPANTIRYYDRAGLLPHLKRDKNGYRLFTEVDLYDLKMIQCFRDVGVSVEELSEMLNAPFISEENSIVERHMLIQKQKGTLIKQRERIDFALLMIDIKLDHYSAIHSGHKHTDQAKQKIINFILERTLDSYKDKTKRLLEEAFNKNKRDQPSELIEEITIQIIPSIKPEYHEEIKQTLQWIENF